MAEKVQPQCPDANMLALQLRALTLAMFVVSVHYDIIRSFHKAVMCCVLCASPVSTKHTVCRVGEPFLTELCL